MHRGEKKKEANRVKEQISWQRSHPYVVMNLGSFAGEVILVDREIASYMKYDL